MASYDYGQLQAVNPAYQQGYTTMPPQSHQSIDPANQYQMINSYQPPLQQGMPPSQYSSMMMYPPKTDANFLTHIPSPLPLQQMTYSMAPNGGTLPLPERFFFAPLFSGILDANYIYPASSMPISNGNVPYPQQQQQQPAPPQPQQQAPISTVNDEKSEPQLISFD